MSAPATTTLLADRLCRWLVDGEIVSESGAYFAWFDAEKCEPAFEYPEITGYALTHLASLSDPTAEERASAARAAAWLVDRWRRGDHSARSGWDNDREYYFDIAMEANGLLLAGDRLAMPESIEVALLMVGSMLTEVSQHNLLPALVTGDESTRPTGWSTQGLAHMGKAAQCFLHAALVEPDLASSVGDATEVLVRQVLGQQRADGRFVTDPNDFVTMIHPHLYAVEGLWCYARATGDTNAAAAASAGAAWVWQHQLPSGGLPRLVATQSGMTELSPEQLDVTAQAIRAAYLTGTNLSAAQRAADRLAEVSVDRGGGRSAMTYQPTAGVLHLNAWVTLFSAQALRLAAGGEISWRELV